MLPNNDKKSVLVAHRGCLQTRPENTWVSLQAALEAGTGWLEFDIQMCRDHDFVLMHDHSLLRTTGINQTVFDLTSDQLIQISAHEPARFGDQFMPSPVSLLKDILARLTAYPKVQVMVEIKKESIAHFGLSAVMNPLLETLAEHQEQCVLISFNHDAIAYTHANSNLRTGWVLHKYDATHRQQATQLQADYLICDQRKLPPGKVPWPGDWKWMLYEINDPHVAADWLNSGVDLIETADISGLRNHLLR